jgi:NhaC family Na+:H+ antiporter
MAATLGVATMMYLPFCIFNIAAPIFALLWGFTGFKIDRIQPAAVPPEALPKAS